MNHPLNPALPPMAAAPALRRRYLAILLPMILANLLQVSAGTLDGIYLGQMLGVPALAAAAAFFPLFFLLLAIIIGLSTGATVLIGHASGARDPEQVRAIAGTAIALVLAAGVSVSVLGTLCAPALLGTLGTPAEILDDATGYARIMLIGAPLIFLLWLASAISRGVGDATSPLRALALATAITMLGTPALIRGWGGLPQLGINSAAVSTLLAHALALLWLGRHWQRSGHPLAPGRALLRQIRVDAGIARRVLRIGIPASLQLLTMALAEVVLLGLVNRHGYQATAAYGAVNQVMGWIQLPAMSLGITATILCAHAIGAGHADQTRAIVRTGLWLNIAVTGTVVALVYALSPLILHGFLDDRQVRALALQLLHICAWSVLVLGAVNVLVGAMRARGIVLWPAALGMAAILGIELPLAYLLHHWLGLSGIWWAYPAGFVAMLVLQTGYLLRITRHAPVAGKAR